MMRRASTPSFAGTSHSLVGLFIPIVPFPFRRTCGICGSAARLHGRWSNRCSRIVLAFAHHGGKSKSAVESPCTGFKIAPRIHSSIETSVPICGEKPSRGPRTFRSLCADAPVVAARLTSRPAPTIPQPTAEDFRNFRRFMPCIALFLVAPDSLGSCAFRVLFTHIDRTLMRFPGSFDANPINQSDEKDLERKTRPQNPLRQVHSRPAV